MQQRHLVHGAVRMAFPELRTPRTEEQRQAVDRLGRTGAALRELHRDLELWPALTSAPRHDGGQDG